MVKTENQKKKKKTYQGALIMGLHLTADQNLSSIMITNLNMHGFPGMTRNN